MIEWIQKCEICQRYKNEYIMSLGLLQPIEIPSAPWKHISMDFVEKLLMSNGTDTVLVVVDMLSKYGHFIPLCHPLNAEEIATVFFDQIFKLHGLPDSIICDRDKVFISKFWTSIFEKLGVQLKFTSAYHP